MKISDNWLRQYIKYRETPEDLAGKLSMLGLEIESIERLGEKYSGFVVGKVVECRRHPNAEKLTVCKVDVGKEPLQIVCGAPNVAVGQKVPVGLSGATVPRNQHDPEGKPFVLANARIRGIDSYGMICSEYELDLGSDADGIMVLPPRARVGQKLASYIGMDDVVYDIEITANRPDWLSHFGVAREVGVLIGKQPKLPPVKLKESREPVRKCLNVKVEDPENCPRFIARVIRNVTIGPSPEWMQQYLRSVGMRPRNNVVDVTNYVMLECGQPLHAFDYSLLRGGKIIVRQAKSGTSFTTLDEQVHTLAEGMVMVCDAEREVSIAGIMGGANSEINNATTDIVLEAACWNPGNIRRTAKSLAISTDASRRFERGADPNGPAYAIDRAAQLVSELAGGTILKGAIDVYPRKVKPKSLPVRPRRVNEVLGTALTKKEIVRILGLLGIATVNQARDNIQAKVPTFRVDIEREIDLIEEVARVYGYDRIEEKTRVSVDLSHTFPKVLVSDIVRDILVGADYKEVITNSIVDPRKAALADAKQVRILNPLGRDMSILRTSLIPGMLDVVMRNQSFGNTNLRLFEIGHVFSEDESSRVKYVDNILEEEKLCMLVAGKISPTQWSEAEREVDIFDLKGDMTRLLDRTALDKWKFIYYSTTKTLADNPILVEIHGGYAGYLGKLSKRVSELFGLEQDIFVAEINLSSLGPSTRRKYEPHPRYPVVKRDIALVVDQGTPAGNLEAAIRHCESKFLRDVELFDIYQGEKLSEGKKSLAFSLTMMSSEKTLTEEEIESELQYILRHVEEKFGAQLRAV